MGPSFESSMNSTFWQNNNTYILPTLQACYENQTQWYIESTKNENYYFYYIY